MKKIFLFFALLTSGIGASAQVAVTVTNPSNSTPALAATYPSLSAAINDLNTVTAFSGPVTLSCAATGTETAPAGGYVINFTGATSAANNVIINGSGSTITASNALGAGNLNDAIFKIVGSDFVTLQNFTMQENVVNTTIDGTTNNMTEWGVALLYASATNGAQNNTIQNNTISLNRTYQNTFGIYSNSTHTATSVTASATATSSAGGNSNLKIYTNNISNVNMGICIVGPTAAADQNTGIDIGGVGNVTGNTIRNFGSTGTFSGYANVSATVNGILVRNSIGFNVSYNSITSSTGASGVTLGTLNGIQIPTASNTATGTFMNNVNNNTIALTTNVAAGGINGINIGSGTGSTACTFNVNNNNFTSINYIPAAANGVVTLISYANGATALATNINSNTFSNLSINTSGSVNFISRSGAMASGNSETVNSNRIVGSFSKTIAGGTVSFYTSAISGSVLGSTITATGNNFSNISVLGNTIVTCWTNGDGVTSANSPLKNISNNIFNNIVASGTPTGTIQGISINAATDGSTVNGNTISNFSAGGACIGLAYGANGAGTITIANNNIFKLSSLGAINGIQYQAAANLNITGNTLDSFSTTGASQINGIITTSGATVNISKNNIYDLLVNNAGATINGIAYSGGTTINVYNNFISGLSAPISSGTVVINGIFNLAGTNTNIYYNTIVLGKSSSLTSSGTNFGLNGIQYASTSNVVLKNNIVWIDATPTGTGTIAAIRRSTSGTAGTAPTAANFSTNNNIYNIKNPGINKYLYVEGTTVGAVKNGYGINIGITDDATNNLINDPNFNVGCSKYKAFMGSGREIGSFIEDNLTASGAPNFTFAPSGASLAESAGVAIASPSITDDYAGVVRSNPSDIGALQFSGTAIDAIAPVINFTNILNTSCTSGPTLNATITDANGVNTIAGLAPRLYFRKAGAAAEADAFLNYPTENTNAFNGWKYVEATGVAPNFTFALNYGLLTSTVVDGDSIVYFVAAQDMNGNVGRSTVTFPTAFCPTSVNMPAVGAVPTSALLSYKISAATGNYITISNGEWNNAATWSCGMIPPASATNVVIANNITVSNAGNIGGSTTINAGASLTINTDGALTLGNNGGGKIAFVNNGTLNVTGGIFAVNGSVLVNNGANFTQTGGLFAEDGNAAGVAANSVASGTALFSIGTNAAPYNSGTISLTGGTLRIVDPHTGTTAGTTTLSLLYASSGTTATANITPTGTHILEIGDGLSTDAGGNTSGYNLDFWEISGGFKPNILRINAPAGTNRVVASTYAPVATTSLEVVNGEFVFNTATSVFVVNGNITVNAPGILTMNGILTLANGVYIPSTPSLDFSAPSTNAQVISGTGIIRNASTGSTANVTSLRINNTNTSGVTLNVPISVSSTFTPTLGILNTSATNLLTVGINGSTTANAGTITTGVAGWVNGPIKKWFRNNVSAGSTATLPVGNATTYKPVTIAYTSAATTAGTLTASWSSTPPAAPLPSLTEGALAIDALSQQGSWFINAADGLAGGNYTGTFTANGSTDVLDFTKTVLVKRPSTGGAWVLDGTHVTTTGSNTAPVLSRTGFSGFSEFAIGGQNSVALPIGIVYLRGSKQDKTNVLDWKVNCASSVKMELERGADSKTFETIYTENATVARCANSFNYLDNNPLSGVNYYRLKTTDPGGIVKYSTIVQLYNNEGNFELINVVPNPVISSATLFINSVNEGNVNISVTDVAGRVVLQQTAWINAGKTSINMDFSKLAKGVYNISASNENGLSQTVRFVKD